MIAALGAAAAGAAGPGGGGLSSSSSATNGDFGSRTDSQAGVATFGDLNLNKSTLTQYIPIIAVAVVGLVFALRSK